MYSKRSGLILGFHGCDKALRDKIVSEKGAILKPSQNSYDWLGGGSYFWENNQQRALQFAQESKNRFLKLDENSKKAYIKSGKSIIETPAVLGAVIDLGYCLDLLDSEYLKVLKESYHLLCETHQIYGTTIPENIRNKKGELLQRHLDCAVIESIHQFNTSTKNQEFDSVRGVFFEGKDLYPKAGFQEKNHIQIALRNPNCIKGYFIPRELDSKHSQLK